MASSGNFCTLNPLHAQGGGTPDFGTLSDGNLSVSLTDTAFGNFGVTSGKWYWEYRMVSSGTSGSAIGWANELVNSQPELGYNSPSSPSGAQIVYVYLSNNPMNIISDAPKSSSSGGSLSANAISQNDIIGVAADFDNDKWYFSINGSFTDMLSGQNPSDGSNPTCSASGGGGVVTIARTAGFTWFPAIGSWAAPTRDYTVNFGQDSTFGGAITAGGESDGNGFGDFKYSVPTGFLAMCSANLPISDDIDPAQTDDDFPQKQFNAVTYTGNGTTVNVTGAGFQPDFVWIKGRSVGYDNMLFDTNRGTTNILKSNSSAAEITGVSSTLTSFDSDGFTYGSELSGNQSSATYVAWCWRANGGTTASNTDGSITSTVQANTKAGFSICTYTGNATNGATFGHGLSAKPSFVIIKNRDASQKWGVWHQSMTQDDNKILFLNTDAALTTEGTQRWDVSAISSSVFGLGSHPEINGSGADYVSYIWHDVEGMQKFGTFTGNGSTDGPFIYTGFRPRMLFIKRIDSAASWYVLDTARDTDNPVTTLLGWDLTSTESDIGSTNNFDVLSNGLKIRTSGGGLNGSGGDFIFGAWGDVSFKYNNTF